MKDTQWMVITGAPCSGKTSAIELLESRGYAVVQEAARALIDQSLKDGLSLEEIKADELGFETKLLETKIATESALNPNQLIFLDRAIPDSIAYFIKAGFDATAPLAAGRLFRYRKVFLFERLHFKKDAVRSEDAATAERLEILLSESYRILGYDLIRVPVITVTKRVDFILSHLSERSDLLGR